MSILASVAMQGIPSKQAPIPAPAELAATSASTSIGNSNPTGTLQNWRSFVNSLLNAQSINADESAHASALEGESAATRTDAGNVLGDLTSRSFETQQASTRNSRFADTDLREFAVSIATADPPKARSADRSVKTHAAHKRTERPPSPVDSLIPKVSKSESLQHVLSAPGSTQGISGASSDATMAMPFPAVAAPVSASPVSNARLHGEVNPSDSGGEDRSHFSRPVSSSTEHAGTPPAIQSEHSQLTSRQELQSSSAQTDTSSSEGVPAPSEFPKSVLVRSSSLSPEKNSNEFSQVFPSEALPAQSTPEPRAIPGQEQSAKDIFDLRSAQEPGVVSQTRTSVAPKTAAQRSHPNSDPHQASRLADHPGDEPLMIGAAHQFAIQYSSGEGTSAALQRGSEPNAKVTDLGTAIRSDESNSTLSSASPQLPESWSTIGSHRVEAGYRDPSLGWITVRAQAGPGGIHAAVVPASFEAAQVLGSHLAPLNAFLQDQSLHVNTVRLASPEPGMQPAMTFNGDMREGSQQKHEAFQNQNTQTNVESSQAPGFTGRSGTQSESSFTPAAIVTDRHVSVLVE